MTQTKTVPAVINDGILDADLRSYHAQLEARVAREFAPERARFNAEQGMDASGEGCEANHQITRDRLAVLYPLIYSRFDLTFGAWAAWVAQSSCNEFVEGDSFL